MRLKNSALHHRNKLHFKIYSNRKQLVVIANINYYKLYYYKQQFTSNVACRVLFPSKQTYNLCLAHGKMSKKTKTHTLWHLKRDQSHVTNISLRLRDELFSFETERNEPKQPSNLLATTQDTLATIQSILEV